MQNKTSTILYNIIVVWKGIYSRSDTNRTGPEGLFFYYPSLLYCPDQMLAVMLCSDVVACSDVAVMRMPSARLFNRFRAAGTNGYLVVFLGENLRTHLKNHTRYDHGPEIHGKTRRVSLPVDEAQLAGCLRVQVSGPSEWDAGIQ